MQDEINNRVVRKLKLEPAIPKGNKSCIKQLFFLEFLTGVRGQQHG
jgi:hypothetical protein